MKTAVEWYNSKVIELMTQREQGNIDVLEFRNQLDLLLTEAKEMEKSQHKRMYSEEEVYSLLEQSMKDCYLWELEEHYSGDYKNLKEWFEQFKNK